MGLLLTPLASDWCMHVEVDLVSTCHGGHGCLGVERVFRQLLCKPASDHMAHEGGRGISEVLKRLNYWLCKAADPEQTRESSLL